LNSGRQYPFGLMEDEPELVDEVCALAYEMRAEARPRATNELAEEVWKDTA